MKYPTSPGELDDERRLLSRVRDLVRLTASPNDNEARTAAAKACELVREHGLLIAPAHAEKAVRDHQVATERLVQMIAACKDKKSCL